MWFAFALITVIAWGVADMFYKLGSNESDKYSHLKIVVAVGVVMGIHATIYMLTEQIAFDPMWLVKYLPVSLMYILSMTIGYVGLRYIELSISSPVQNSSGAIVAILCFVFLGQTMQPLQIVAVALICLGMVALSVIEKRNGRVIGKEAQDTEDKKYRLSFLAILLPIGYAVIDALGTFFDAIWLDESNNLLTDDPALIEDAALLAYEYTFFICAILVLIYLLVFKKQRLRDIPSVSRFGAAVFETAGQYFYVFAMATEEKAIVAAPMVASYSIVSVLLSRIFLKEKLTVWQYLSIVLVMGGVAILGIFDA